MQYENSAPGPPSSQSLSNANWHELMQISEPGDSGGGDEGLRRREASDTAAGRAGGEGEGGGVAGSEGWSEGDAASSRSIVANVSRLVTRMPSVLLIPSTTAVHELFGRTSADGETLLENVVPLGHATTHVT